MARAKVVRSKTGDAVRLSGLFFIIDGKVWSDATTSPVKHNSHINFFEDLKKISPNINKKYGNYSYLEFPRGMLIRDDETHQIIMSGPDTLTKKQIGAILHAFRYSSSAKYTFEYDEHYTLDYIKTTIRRKLLSSYSNDMVDLEVMEVEEHFNNQMKMFK